MRNRLAQRRGDAEEGNGRLSVKVPAKWLSRYSLVFVEEQTQGGKG